jgi:hypothetical protein
VEWGAVKARWHHGGASIDREKDQCFPPKLRLPPSLAARCLPGVIARVDEAQVVPAAAGPLWHGGGLAARRAPRRVGRRHPVGALGQGRVGRAAGLEVVGVGQCEGQLALVNGGGLLQEDRTGGGGRDPHPSEPGRGNCLLIAER